MEEAMQTLTRNEAPSPTGLTLQQTGAFDTNTETYATIDIDIDVVLDLRVGCWRPPVYIDRTLPAPTVAPRTPGA
jgi:hypothetical protein